MEARGKDTLVYYGLTVPQKELVPHSAPQCLKKVWGTIGRPNLRLCDDFEVCPFQIVASIREVTGMRVYCRLENVRSKQIEP